MPVNPNASAEVTAFRWVPDFAAGLVRDLRIRWALEEIGRAYRVRLLDAHEPAPGRIFPRAAVRPGARIPRRPGPAVRERRDPRSTWRLSDERLLPADENGRMRGIAWLIAALNSVEPMIFELVNIDIFNRGQEWTRERRPQVVEKIAGAAETAGRLRSATRNGSKAASPSAT